MNSAFQDVMEIILAVSLTMTSLAYTFWSMTEWTDTYDTVPSSATVFVEHTEIPEEVLWTGSQVVAKLYQLSGVSVPILVDHVEFNDEIDFIQKQSVINLNRKYSLNTVIDSNGNLKRIVFTSKGA